LSWTDYFKNLLSNIL